MSNGDNMDILDWIVVICLGVFFLGVLFYTLKDALKDRKYYAQKANNITSIDSRKRKRNVSKP